MKCDNEIRRIYNRWELWEDYKFGLYDSISDKSLDEKVVELFSSKKLTRRYMNMAIRYFPFSCEHNLTNNGVNKIAYLGQAACCIYAGIPRKQTMNAWWLVSEKNRNMADNIAKEIIEQYLKTINERQLCLRFI